MGGRAESCQTERGGRDAKVSCNGDVGSVSLIMNLGSVLEKAGVVKPQKGGWDMSMFVNTEVAQLE